MSRLYRPHVPVEIKCRVALRQLGEMFPDRVIAEAKNFADLLAMRLAVLAELLGCEITDLRLDHDPPLAARPLMHKRKIGTVVYKPDANDPDHLAYRPHGPQFAASHLIKTNVRGDHGQYPDRALIKRERRRKKKRVAFGRRAFAKATGKPWPKRKLKSASRWPPKGTRKIDGKKSGASVRRPENSSQEGNAFGRTPESGRRSKSF